MKRLLSLLLVSTFVLQPVSLAYGSLSEHEEAKKYNASVETLNEVFLGKRQGHSLDTYRLLEQDVLLQSDVYDKYLSELKLRKSELEAAIAVEVSLREVNQQKKGFEEFNPYEPIQETERETKLRDELYEVSQTIEIQEDQDVLSKKHATQIKENNSFANKISLKKLEYKNLGNEFVLTQDEIELHKFRIEATSIKRVGDYLVFLEKGMFSKKQKLQHISFIDLGYYKKAIGRTTLPIFRLPIETELEVLELVDSKGAVRVGNIDLKPEVLKIFSQVQILGFNITVNLLDSATYENSVELIASFHDYFNQVVEASSKGEIDSGISKSIDTLSDQLVTELNVQKDTQLKDKDFKEKFDEAVKKLEKEATKDPFVQSLQDKEVVTQKITEVKNSMIAQRKLGARIGLMFSKITDHRPLGAPKIRQSLAKVAGAVAMPWKKEKRAGFREGVDSLARHPYAKWGAGIAAAAVTGEVFFAEGMSQFYTSVLEMSQFVQNKAFGKADDLIYLNTEAATKTITGFNPIKLVEAYAPKLQELSVGLPALFITLYSVISIPHLTVNTFKLIKDLKKTDLTSEKGFYNKLKKLKAAFIERENTNNLEYLKLQAETLSKDEGPKTYTETQEKWVDEFIASRTQKKDKKGLFSFIKKLKFSKLLPQRAKNLFKKNNNVEITTLRAAVIHFLVGWTAFSNSAKAFTNFWWNGYFIFRNTVIKPPVFAYMVTHPRFVNTALLDYKSEKITIPSKLNGGADNTLTYLSNLYSKFRKSPKASELEAWEKNIISVEETIGQEVLRKTLNETIKGIKNADEIQRLVEQGGISHINDDYFVNKKTRTQFRVLFDMLMSASMKEYLQRLAKSSDDLSEAVLKKQTLSIHEQVSVTTQEAKDIVKTVLAKGEVQELAKKRSNTLSLSKVSTNLKYNRLATLDPQKNRSMRRVQKIKQQLDKPDAVARAVRSTIAATIIDKPMELAFLFICMAGIQMSSESGLLTPIQPEMFGPNSFFYLSSYVFLTTYLSGVISSVFSEAGIKLQEDEKNDANFGEVPDRKDKKLSYLGYFGKKFVDSRNSLTSNWAHMNRILLANMPGFFVHAFIINQLTLGRFDLDVFTISWICAFLIPEYAMGVKIEQSFELTSGYDLKDVPEPLRGHPKIQSWYLKQLAKARIKFNLVYKVYENIIGFMLVNLQQMSTERLGDRSMSKIFFAGRTPTMWAEMYLTSIIEYTKDVPVLKHTVAPAAAFCEKILTNNYTAK